MPARRPQDAKGPRGLSVVVQHGDEYALTKLPAYGEVGQTSDTHALFGHTNERLNRAYHGCLGQFGLDAGMLGPKRPSLELPAGRKLVVQAGMGLEVVGDQRNTLGRQIGRRCHRLLRYVPKARVINRESPISAKRTTASKPSSITSTTRSLKSRSNVTSG